MGMQIPSLYRLGSLRAWLQAFLFLAATLLLLAAPFVVKAVPWLALIQALPGHSWGWILILLPSFVVLQHAFYLRLVKRRAVPEAPGANSARMPWQGPGNFGSLISLWELHFRPETLLLRFGLPAILLTFVGLMHFGIFIGGWRADILGWANTGSQPLAQMGAERLSGLLGLAGAYTFVLIYLGTRALRADLTGGGAIWCVVTLVLGPGLALLAGKAIKLENGDGFAQAALCFTAGMAPRRVVGWIVDSTQKFMGNAGISKAMLNNKDLLVIRGVTPGIAARLEEEGIEDAYALAMAEPYRLFRNTAYAPRQVLAWMDEALLHYYLPDTAEELVRKKGITGAIDLAHLGLLAEHQDGSSAMAAIQDLEPLLGGKPQSAMLVRRLAEDQQVARVWRLYNLLDAHGEANSTSDVPPASTEA